MKLTIEIDLDNAAFADLNDGTHEVARILLDIIERIPEPLDQTDGDLSLHDVNGNHVGFARIDT